jgi:hypothetical protein
MRRFDIRTILKDPTQRKEFIIGAIMFIQQIEGIEITKEQAEVAYEKVRGERINENRGSDKIL